MMCLTGARSFSRCVPVLVSAILLVAIMSTSAQAGHVYDRKPVPGMVSPTERTPVRVTTMRVAMTRAHITTTLTLYNPTRTPQRLGLAIPVKLPQAVVLARFASGMSYDATQCLAYARGHYALSVRQGARRLPVEVVPAPGADKNTCHALQRWSVSLRAGERVTLTLRHGASLFAEDDGGDALLTMTQLAAPDHPERWGGPIQRATLTSCGAGVARALLRHKPGTVWFRPHGLKSVTLEHVVEPVDARYARKAGCIRWTRRAWSPSTTARWTLGVVVTATRHDLAFDPDSDADETRQARITDAWCPAGASGAALLGGDDALGRDRLDAAAIKRLEDDALGRLLTHTGARGEATAAQVAARWKLAPEHARAMFRSEVARYLAAALARRAGMPDIAAREGRGQSWQACLAHHKPATSSAARAVFKASRAALLQHARGQAARYRRAVRPLKLQARRASPERDIPRFSPAYSDP